MKTNESMRGTAEKILLNYYLRMKALQQSTHKVPAKFWVDHLGLTLNRADMASADDWNAKFRYMVVIQNDALLAGKVIEALKILSPEDVRSLLNKGSLAEKKGADDDA